MANLGVVFDPKSVPADEYDALPVGEYHAQIVESEMKSTKDGSGQMLKLTMDILSGPCEGRKIFDNLNLHNANEMTQRIAQQTLAKICNAVGVAALQDSEELHFKPMMVKVGMGKGDYADRNQVKGYRSVGAAAPAAPRPAGPAPAAAPRAAAPWPRRA
jgi:hypothetical protein